MFPARPIIGASHTGSAASYWERGRPATRLRRMNSTYADPSTQPTPSPTPSPHLSPSASPSPSPTQNPSPDPTPAPTPTMTPTTAPSPTLGVPGDRQTCIWRNVYARSTLFIDALLSCPVRLQPDNWEGHCSDTAWDRGRAGSPDGHPGLGCKSRPPRSVTLNIPANNSPPKPTPCMEHRAVPLTRFSKYNATREGHASTAFTSLPFFLPQSGSYDDFVMARLDPDNRTGTVGDDPLSRNFNWNMPLVGMSGRAGLNLGLSLLQLTCLDTFGQLHHFRCR